MCVDLLAARIHVCYRDIAAGKLRYLYTTSDGGTASTPVDLATAGTAGTSAIVATQDGYLLVRFGTARYRSNDGGTTWVTL